MNYLYRTINELKTSRFCKSKEKKRIAVHSHNRHIEIIYMKT